MLLTVLTFSLLAAAPTPTALVKEGNAAIQKAASQPGATVQSLSTVVEGFVDFQELAKRSMGKNWDTLTPIQRKEFTETMTGLLRASYAQKALGQGKVDVRYDPEKIEGAEATVPTHLGVKGEEVSVKYQLAKLGAKGEWRIYDVVTDEVSLVETYQGQFRRLLTERGFVGLLTTLKTKRSQLEKANAEKP